MEAYLNGSTEGSKIIWVLGHLILTRCIFFAETTVQTQLSFQIEGIGFVQFIKV
jgi:hypothetical protein